MRSLAIITMALGAILIAAALRRDENKQTAREVEPLALRAVATRPGAEIVSAPNFGSEFLNLLAPFETSDDTDAFLREKRAAAFQQRIEQLTAAEMRAAYEAAVSIHAANPTEAAADLRDRLLQRWRELTSASDSAIPQTASVTETITDLADADPTAAAMLALEQLAPDQEQANVIIGIVQRFAAQDSAAARAWVAQFPEGDLRSRALSQLNRIGSSSREPDSPAAQ